MRKFFMKPENTKFLGKIEKLANFNWEVICN